MFHYKPSIWGYPYFWKHPYIPLMDTFWWSDSLQRICKLMIIFVHIHEHDGSSHMWNATTMLHYLKFLTLQLRCSVRISSEAVGGSKCSDHSWLFPRSVQNPRWLWCSWYTKRWVPPMVPQIETLLRADGGPGWQCSIAPRTVRSQA